MGCGNQPCKKEVPIDPNSSQAELPELPGHACYESDPKWLGTKIWPSEQQKRSLIERDLIGKGRQESCGCQFMGSVECIQLHIGEKVEKLKLELGAAYYEWKFDCMGEIVSHSWTNEDESKFHEIVVSYEECFWNELFKHFDKKERATLVSYYFNVFLLKKQRGCPSNPTGGSSSFTKTRKRKPKKKDESFWTVCDQCKVRYEFDCMYRDKNLICPECKSTFTASEIMIRYNG